MKMTTLNDCEALFELLAGINEAGGDPQVAGLDKDGRAFLANLAGPYAESAVAVMGNPWDSEVGWHDECDECAAGRGAIWNAERLTYPVIVLEARAIEETPKETR